MTRLAVPRRCSFPPSRSPPSPAVRWRPRPAEDPDVRGNLAGTFIWAVAEPTLAIGDLDPGGARESVDWAAAVIDDDRDIGFGITVVAAFETAEQAEAHADDVRDPRGRRGTRTPANATAPRPSTIQKRGAADAARRGGDDRRIS